MIRKAIQSRSTTESLKKDELVVAVIIKKQTIVQNKMPLWETYLYYFLVERTIKKTSMGMWVFEKLRNMPFWMRIFSS